MGESLPEHNYYKDHFGTLEEISKSVGDGYFDVSMNKVSNKAFEKMQETEWLEKITARLDELGFRKFKVLGAGTYSLVLETTNGQLVRISPVEGEKAEISKTGKRGGKVPEVSTILQPIQTYDIGTFKMSIFPEVRPPLKNQLSRHSLDALRAELAKEGFFYDDMPPKERRAPSYKSGSVQEKNVCVLSGNTPVLIDIDAVIHINDVKDEYKEQIQDMLDEFASYEHVFSWELPDGTWKQHDEFPQIWNSGKPEAGKLTGVYPRDEIEEAREKMAAGSKKEKTLDEVAAGYEEDVVERLEGLVKNAEAAGKSVEAQEMIKGK